MNLASVCSTFTVYISSMNTWFAVQWHSWWSWSRRADRAARGRPLCCRRRPAATVQRIEAPSQQELPLKRARERPGPDRPAAGWAAAATRAGSPSGRRTSPRAAAGGGAARAGGDSRNAGARGSRRGRSCSWGGVAIPKAVGTNHPDELNR